MTATQGPSPSVSNNNNNNTNDAIQEEKKVSWFSRLIKREKAEIPDPSFQAEHYEKAFYKVLLKNFRIESNKDSEKSLKKTRFYFQINKDYRPVDDREEAESKSKSKAYFKIYMHYAIVVEKKGKIKFELVNYNYTHKGSKPLTDLDFLLYAISYFDVEKPKKRFEKSHSATNYMDLASVAAVKNVPADEFRVKIIDGGPLADDPAIKGVQAAVNKFNQLVTFTNVDPRAPKRLEIGHVKIEDEKLD